MAINTLTDIANQALVNIGYGSSISNIETNADPASKVRIVLDGVIESVQREFWWQELIVETELLADAVTRSDNLKQYSLPNNYLRLFAVNTNCPYRVEGRKILSSEEAPLKIRYLKLSENVGEWSSELKECIYTLLSSRIAIPIRGDKAQAQYYLQIYETKILPMAKTRQSKDNLSETLRTPYQSGWLKTYYHDYY